MAFTNNQQPAKKIKIRRRRPGQVFIRPPWTPSPEDLDRLKTNKAVDDLVAELSKTDLSTDIDIDIHDEDPDAIISELSSRLADSNIEVEDEGYVSSRTSPELPSRRVGDSSGLSPAELHPHKEAEAKAAYARRNVINLDSMLSEDFWNSLPITDRIKIKDMGGNMHTPVQGMKVMLVKAIDIERREQQDKKRKEDALVRRLDELF
ncbi:hypothetical protein PMZ80_005631 [Knufia obscura]|uniref:Uncharacterized protein n=2 Tax=Knufia TaxID=430999 RepID=A0AAN8EAM6_9EURO|nr:hypothetical protein PMZ80_005631 [Knufia obscura]KAK5949390.1 hypothetical protein OHC33_009563 [Knufia fluminis]